MINIVEDKYNCIRMMQYEAPSKSDINELNLRLRPKLGLGPEREMGLGLRLNWD